MATTLDFWLNQNFGGQNESVRPILEIFLPPNYVMRDSTLELYYFLFKNKVKFYKWSFDYVNFHTLVTQNEKNIEVN